MLQSLLCRQTSLQVTEPHTKVFSKGREVSYQPGEVCREILILHNEKPRRRAPLGVSSAWQDGETGGTPAEQKIIVRRGAGVVGGSLIA